MLSYFLVHSIDECFWPWKEVSQYWLKLEENAQASIGNEQSEEHSETQTKTEGLTPLVSGRERCKHPREAEKVKTI
jgi:hypothetical protein